MRVGVPGERSLAARAMARASPHLLKPILSGEAVRVGVPATARFLLDWGRRLGTHFRSSAGQPVDPAAHPG